MQQSVQEVSARQPLKRAVRIAAQPSWTDAELDSLLRWWTAGRPVDWLSKKLGRSEPSIRSEVTRREIPPRNYDRTGAYVPGDSRRMRHCLCCSRYFFSHGVGNRMCLECRNDPDEAVAA